MKKLFAKIKNLFSHLTTRLVVLPKKVKIISVVVASVIVSGTVIGIAIGTSHEHEYIQKVFEPTCENQGYTLYMCECGDSYKDTYTVAALGHTRSDWITEKEATCTKDGNKYIICLTCNEILNTETIPNLGGHDIIYVTDIAPTCINEGIQHGICSVCDELLPTLTLPLASHSYGDWIIDKEATCTSIGIKYKECSVCGEKSDTTTIPLLAHTNGEWIIDEVASCTENGSKHQICSVCNTTIKTAAISATGHSDGEWIVDKAATCTEDGSKHQICSVCNATIKTETLTSFGHNYKEYLPQKACVDKSIVYQCQNCKDTYSIQLQAISANIDYCYWSYVDSTCYVQDVLSINGIQGGYGKYTITITYTDPIRESHVYTYTNVDDLYTTKYLGGASWGAYYRQSYPPFVTIEIEDELGFKTTYTAYFPTLNPDNYLAGYNLYSQKVIADVSAETPHNYSVRYTAPTANSSGYTTFTCSDCNHSKNEQWENISIDLNYSSEGYGMYGLTVNNVSGGAILYQDGIRVKNRYTISIVNIAIGYVENSGFINEGSGSFSTNTYTVSTYCKYNIVISDGYSTYIFSTDYVYQHPVLREHIVTENDNIIRFSASYDRHDSYDLYRLRIDAIYGGNKANDGINSYTITVKNLSDNSVKTYTDVKEFSGIAVSSSYSSYNNQRYEITISDGTYTYIYTTSIWNSTPQLKT